MDAAAARATRAVPSIPCDADGPVFREPWEAQAFAMALALHERGLFTWNEWAATLSGEIKRAQASGDPDTGETYYRHWLATLERLISAKGRRDIRDPAPLSRCLGPRRRSHPAWLADRIEAGGFWAAILNGRSPDAAPRPGHEAARPQCLAENSCQPFARNAQAGHSPQP